MTIQQLEQLLIELARTTNKSQTEMIQDIADYAQLKYGNNISESNRKIIDTVKEKLLNGLYEMTGHSYVTKRPDYATKFSLDKLEMEVIKQAGEELEKEELIDGNENYTQLTGKGVLEAKKLRGDL